VGLVQIGKVVRALGLKGYLGVAGSEGLLGELDEVTLRLGAGPARSWSIEEARPQGRLWAVKVAGVSDRTAAEALVGAEVLVPRESLSGAGEGRLLWVDLEGLEVVTAAGEAVGRVTGLYETGAVDVLIVTGPGGEKLVPLAPYVTVDSQARRIVVDPPPGLLD
jgi:16S rRNA processing protein RimM